MDFSMIACCLSLFALMMGCYLLWDNHVVKKNLKRLNDKYRERYSVERSSKASVNNNQELSFKEIRTQIQQLQKAIDSITETKSKAGFNRKNLVENQVTFKKEKITDSIIVDEASKHDLNRIPVEASPKGYTRLIKSDGQTSLTLKAIDGAFECQVNNLENENWNKIKILYNEIYDIPQVTKESSRLSILSNPVYIKEDDEYILQRKGTLSFQ